MGKGFRLAWVEHDQFYMKWVEAREKATVRIFSDLCRSGVEVLIRDEYLEGVQAGRNKVGKRQRVFPPHQTYDVCVRERSGVL